jgi:hypothetical protein
MFGYIYNLIQTTLNDEVTEWLLAFGYWKDTGFWDDTAYWIDN